MCVVACAGFLWRVAAAEITAELARLPWRQCQRPVAHDGAVCGGSLKRSVQATNTASGAENAAGKPFGVAVTTRGVAATTAAAPRRALAPITTNRTVATAAAAASSSSVSTTATVGAVRPRNSRCSVSWHSSTFAAVVGAPNSPRRTYGLTTDEQRQGDATRSMSSLVAEAALLNADKHDMDDPAAFVAYVNDIHAHHRDTEVAKTASFGYMSHQTDVNEKMRAILIDWLLEVHLKFKLLPESLYLTVNLIDRFLERKPVMRQKLQLVGVTAMLLASKYEEIYPPEVKDFVFITSNAYTHEEILAMEAAMLNTLRFELYAPTSFVFMNRYCRVADADATVRNLAQYCVERTLQEYSALRFKQSEIAAAAVNVALRTAGTTGWTEDLVACTRYSEAHLRPIIEEIERWVSAPAQSLKAAKKKFTTPRFGEIARMPLRLIGTEA